MKGLYKVLAAFCLFGLGCAANAATVNFGEYQDSVVKTVDGIWTYNERVSFSEAGRYRLNFVDFDFGSTFEYVGAMISTSDQKLASITIENGVSSSLLPIEFDVGEHDYWLSIFALTSSLTDIGTLGLDIAMVGVSEVPAPPALILLLSALLLTARMVGRSTGGQSRDSSTGFGSGALSA